MGIARFVLFVVCWLFLLYRRVKKLTCSHPTELAGYQLAKLAVQQLGQLAGQQLAQLAG